ncbi:MAG TPA: acyloxyacyl hydrolase [Terrimicrobiaceae bacterium]
MNMLLTFRSTGEDVFLQRAPALSGKARGRFSLIVCAVAVLLGGTMKGESLPKTILVEEEKVSKERRWEVSLETAGLFGLRNPNNYVIAPQFLSLAWQPFPQWKLGPVRLKGQILLTLVGEPIVQGPESYFLGGALRVRLIFPIGNSRWSFYADGGGGMGGIDSDDTPFGQGQDFAFCLLASGGVRFAVTNAWSVWVGFLWQHLSNAELSEPRRRNTGLDAIGPIGGVSYQF